MAILSDFSTSYSGECEHCGQDLEDWEWLEDEMVFRTECTCGTEYTLKPTNCIISVETGDLEIEDEDEDEE